MIKKGSRCSYQVA